MRYERIARVAHEANRAYCEACGDYSNVRWEEAPEWQQASAIEGVKAHALISPTPRESHTLWMKQKLAEGWRYGPIKDASARTHPCLVEYDALPPWQQTKDILFSAVVKALLTSGDQ